MAHPGGRPIEYNQNFVFKTQEYILKCQDEEVLRKKTENSSEFHLKVKLPSIEGLAYFLGISKETIYQWEKIYPEFSDVLDKLRQLQAERLMNNGLAGNYNPMITKLLLAKHGYRDSQELVGAEGKDLIPDPDTKKAADDAVKAYITSTKMKEDDNTGNTQQQQPTVN